jgi:hypothetical protein
VRDCRNPVGHDSQTQAARSQVDELAKDVTVLLQHRSLQRKYERRQQERRAVLRSNKREGLFAREGGQLGDRKSVSPEEAVNPRDASGEHDGELHKPN